MENVPYISYHFLYVKYWRDNVAVIRILNKIILSILSNSRNGVNNFYTTEVWDFFSQKIISSCVIDRRRLRGGVRIVGAVSRAFISNSRNSCSTWLSGKGEYTVAVQSRDDGGYRVQKSGLSVTVYYDRGKTHGARDVFIMLRLIRATATRHAGTTITNGTQ